MMPYIALILTILFVLFIFKIDAKRKSTVSFALWIPLIWMMYSAAKPISFWLGTMPSATSEEMLSAEGNPIDRNILSILLIVSLYVLFKRKTEWLSIFKKNSFITIWFLYCGISILWSEYPLVAFKRLIKDIGILLSILIVLTESDPIDAVKTLIKRFSYILVPFSILLIIYFPESGIVKPNDVGWIMGKINYAGVSWNKNGLARICSISGFFFICNLIAKRQMKNTENNKEKYLIQALFILIILYLLIILDSATSTGVLVIGIIIFFMLGTKILKNNSKYLGRFIIFSFIVGIILQYSLDLVDMFITFSGRDLTLTGRVNLWKDLLTLHTNPLIGVGYGSLWVKDRVVMVDLGGGYGSIINESHNGYLNVYLELGKVGIFLLTGVIYSAYRNINKELKYNFDYWRFRMALFVIVLLYNVTEDAFGRFTLMWFVFLLISVDLPKKSQLHYSGKVTSLASCSPSGQK